MDEMLDKELHGVMGSMILDGNTPKQMPVLEKQVQAPKSADKAAPKAAESADDFTPVKKRDWVDKAIDMLKWLICCGSISMLLWWFEVNGLMAMEAAYPCILASAMIGTGGVVWNVRE